MLGRIRRDVRDSQDGQSNNTLYMSFIFAKFSEVHQTWIGGSEFRSPQLRSRVFVIDWVFLFCCWNYESCLVHL